MIQNQYTKAGTIIGSKGKIVHHVGVITNNQIDFQPTVISNTLKYGGVVEETLDSFLDGNELTILGYPSNEHPFKVISRARAKIGEKYSLFNNNCEHFVRKVHGLAPSSPQLQRALILFGISVIISFLFFRK